MNTITIRDIRLRWPAAEARLQTEQELVITRDGLPVAKLVRLDTPLLQRPRFTPEQHRRWQQSVFGPGKTMRWVDSAIESERTDRHLGKQAK